MYIICHGTKDAASNWLRSNEINREVRILSREELKNAYFRFLYGADDNLLELDEAGKVVSSYCPEMDSFFRVQVSKFDRALDDYLNSSGEFFRDEVEVGPLCFGQYCSIGCDITEIDGRVYTAELNNEGMFDISQDVEIS